MACTPGTPERDRLDERDEGWFDIRRPRFSERRISNTSRWFMPDTMLLPISPVPPFPLLVTVEDQSLAIGQAGFCFADKQRWILTASTPFRFFLSVRFLPPLPIRWTHCNARDCCHDNREMEPYSCPLLLFRLQRFDMVPIIHLSRALHRSDPCSQQF